MKEIKFSLKVPDYDAIMRAVWIGAGLFCVSAAVYINYYAQTWENFALLNSANTWFMASFWCILFKRWHEKLKEVSSEHTC